MFDLQLEEAAMNAWPALYQIHRAGWLLRFSAGYSKRANSATPLYDSVAPHSLSYMIDACEQHYRLHRQPPIFRLIPIERAQELDERLADRGYALVDTTLVMVRSLDMWAELPEYTLPITHHFAGSWLTHYCQASGEEITAHAVHLEMLNLILPPAAFVTMYQGERVVGCGMAVAEGGCVGLFSLVTAPDARRQGIGTQLVSYLLRWGEAQGARRAYLQVVERNEPALSLYHRLGFREAYRYWYRVGHALP